LSNHGLIRLRKFVSQKIVIICAINYFFSIYLILYMYQAFDGIEVNFREKLNTVYA
jgi:hypothetical protein